MVVYAPCSIPEGMGSNSWAFNFPLDNALNHEAHHSSGEGIEAIEHGPFKHQSQYTVPATATCNPSSPWQPGKTSNHPARARLPARAPVHPSDTTTQQAIKRTIRQLHPRLRLLAVESSKRIRSQRSKPGKTDTNRMGMGMGTITPRGRKRDLRSRSGSAGHQRERDFRERKGKSDG